MVFTDPVGLAMPRSCRPLRESRTAAGSGMNNGDQIGMLPLISVAGIFPIQAEPAADLAVARRRQNLQPPAEAGGGIAQRTDCVADIVLRVPESPLTIFPGLPPNDRAEPDQKAARRQIRGRFINAALFKRMVGFLPAGTVIAVRVRKGSLVGKYTRWVIRARKLPARKDLCLYPGSSKPARCPA